MWLHSSVGKASHWYRRGHRFESRWSPDFFQASSYQLLKLENLLQWSLFTFIYNCSTNMNHFIYISHQTFSLVTLQHSQTLKIVEIFCSLNMYFSSDKNDNLSSLAGPFIAENVNNKILTTSHHNIVVTKSLKRLSFHSYVYPDLVRHCCVISH